MDGDGCPICCGIWLGNWKACCGVMPGMFWSGLKAPPAPRPWPGGSIPMLTNCWWAWICCCCCCRSSICCWMASCSTGKRRLKVRRSSNRRPSFTQTLTLRVCEHAHQRRQLRRTPSMRNVQSPTGGARDTSGRGLLLLVHDGRQLAPAGWRRAALGVVPREHRVVVYGTNGLEINVLIFNCPCET